MRKYLYAIAASAVLLVGVLANVGNAAPAKHHPKPPPTVLGSSASLKFSLGAPTEVVLPKSQPFRGHKIVTTAKLPKGFYEITAQFTGEDAICWLDTKVETFTASAHQFGIVDTDEIGSGGVTAGVPVHKGQRIGEYCGDVGSTDNGDILTAGITAIRVPKNLPGSVTSNVMTGAAASAVRP
jgi:hypothetical protein